jgi:hypothetical protein
MSLCCLLLLTMMIMAAHDDVEIACALKHTWSRLALASRLVNVPLVSSTMHRMQPGPICIRSPFLSTGLTHKLQ